MPIRNIEFESQSSVNYKFKNSNARNDNSAYTLSKNNNNI